MYLPKAITDTRPLLHIYHKQIWRNCLCYFYVHNQVFWFPVTRWECKKVSWKCHYIMPKFCHYFVDVNCTWLHKKRHMWIYFNGVSSGRNVLIPQQNLRQRETIVVKEMSQSMKMFYYQLSFFNIKEKVCFFDLEMLFTPQAAQRKHFWVIRLLSFQGKVIQAELTLQPCFHSWLNLYCYFFTRQHNFKSMNNIFVMMHILVKCYGHIAYQVLFLDLWFSNCGTWIHLGVPRRYIAIKS